MTRETSEGDDFLSPPQLLVSQWDYQNLIKTLVAQGKTPVEAKHAVDAVVTVYEPVVSDSSVGVASRHRPSEETT